MPAALVTLPDGRKAKVTFADERQLNASVSDLTGSKDSGSITEEADNQNYRKRLEEANPIERAEGKVREAVGAPALKMLSSGAGSALGAVEGGIRGVGAGAASLVMGEGVGKAKDAFVDEAADTIAQRQRDLTIEPKTKTGARSAALVEKPFTYIASKADKAGEYVSDKTGSPALGAATSTALQAAPALIGKGVAATRGAIGRLGRGTVAEGTAAPPPGAPPAGPSPAAAPGSPELSATAIPRTPPAEMPGEAPGSPPQPAANAPGAAQAPPATQTPPAGPAVTGGSSGGPQGGPAPRPTGAAPGTPPAGGPAGGTPKINPNSARAQAYATRIGLDWSRMGAGTRAALENIAQDAGALDRLDPAAVERQAHLESQRIPVPATRAQITLDPVDARKEAIAARTREGDRIRDTDTAANAAIQGNLEALRGRVAGLRGGLHEPVDPKTGMPSETPSLRTPTKTPTQVGAAKQGALREKEKWSKKGYQALYKIARETEPTARVPLKAVGDLLEKNPEIQHLGWVESWLAKAERVHAATQAKAAGSAVTEAASPMDSITLNELHDLRSTAGDIARTGGKEGHYAGQVVKALDQAMESAPEGAKAWKAANEAYKKHQQEFANQSAVRRLVQNKKGGNDPSVSHEKTWKTVATGDLAGLRQVKQSLLTGGTAATRMAGRRAWRDFRAETVNRILEDARNVTSTDQTERAILTAAALRRSINRIPAENLEEILGKANARELRGILRSRELTRGRTTESGTVPNILVMAEKILGHIPVVGHVGRAGIGLARGAQHLHELGKGAADTTAALTTPLAKAEADVARSAPVKKGRRQALYDSIEAAGPTLPPGPGGTP